MGIQYSLYLRWIDVETKTHDEFLGAPDDEQTFGIQRRSRFIWRTVITLHYIRSTHPKLTHFPVRYKIPVAIHELYFDSRKYAAHRSIRARFIGVSLGDIWRTFRNTVPIE